MATSCVSRRFTSARASSRSCLASPSEGSSETEADEQLSDDELAALKKQLGTTKALKAKQDNFTHKLREARAALQEPTARDLVLGILRSDLDAILGRYVASQRQQLIAVFEIWWDKYRVTLTSIEQARDSAAHQLRGYLMRLGYGAE